MSETVAVVHNIPISYQHLLFSELARMGLPVEVLFTAARSVHRPENVPLAEAAYRFRIGFGGDYENAPHLRSFLFVFRALEEIQPVAVIIGGWSDAAACGAWMWALARRKPRILWTESTAGDRRRLGLKERVKRLYVKPFDIAHVYGSRSREYMRGLGFPDDRIVTGRILVNDALFAPVNRDELRIRRGRVVLYVGRLSAEKNIETLLRAMQRALSHGARGRLSLRLVGSGPEEDRLRTLSAELGLLDVVEFEGFVPQARLPAVYHSADVLVLPSLSETWGLVVNEAMLCGLPAIVSDRCGCAPDLVTPSTGWTFPAPDVEALAGCLIGAAELPEQALSDMRSAARRRALAYSPAACATSVIACVQRAMSLSRQAEGAQAA